LTTKLSCPVLVRALGLHSLRDQVPLLPLEARLDLLSGLEEDGVVLFFDDDEVGFETALNTCISVVLGVKEELLTSSDSGGSK
jgi:hypothetical protein